MRPIKFSLLYPFLRKLRSMCLSAPISFTLSAGLMLTGLFFVKKSSSKYLWPLALIPFFFGLQQGAEGFVWLDSSLFAKNIFLFFAYSFWPVWVPFSFWFAEKKGRRKDLLAFLTGLGLATGSLLFLLIETTEPLFYRFSIQYHQITTPQSFYPLILVLYFVSTLLPLFISSLRSIKLLGFLLLLLAIIILIIDRYLMVSLWCFESALLCPLIFLLIRRKP